MALVNVGTKAISAGSNAVVDQFRVATAQTLGALAWAPAGSNALVVPRFAKSKKTATLTVTGAGGKSVCLTAAGQSSQKVLTNGTASFSVTLPKRGRTTVTSVDAGGETDTGRITVLRKKNVTFDVKKSKLMVGDKAVVKVRGLKPGESVKVKLRGKTVDRAEVNKQGKKTLRFKLTGKAAKPGRATLKVVGEFGYRHGKQTVRITR